MEHKSTRQSFRIAGFFFFSAAALIAQSSSQSQEPAKLQLIALNTPANVPYPAPAEVPPVSQPAVPSSVVTSPVTVDLAAAKENMSGSKAWFSAGPTALPATARTDATFGLPINRYGAAPAAVGFSFGRK
jgi:hypothetical protein